MKDSELRMIETMLKKQDELNSAIMKEFGLTTISKEQIDMATLDEIGEFTHELKGDWCWWNKSQEQVDRSKVLEELADVFHFVLIYELFYGKSYTLIQYAIQTSKNGEEKEIQKSISFHSTLEGALQGYSNCRMADLVSDYDMDLKFVKEAIDDLKREIKTYE